MDKQKRRLLVVSNMYPSRKYPHYGVFVKHSAEILQNCGYTVDVVSMRKTTGKLRKLFAYAVFYSAVLLKGLFGRYNAVYAHYASHTALPLLILKKFKKLPLIMNVHGNDIVPETEADEKFLGLVKRVLCKAELIICPSLYFKGVVTENYNVPDNKAVVYPSGGVDTEVFAPMSKQDAAKQLGLDENYNYWAYVSRIEEKKGWDLFLKSGAKLLKDRPGTKLIVVGDGDQAQDFAQLAESLGLSERIVKFNLLAQTEIVKIFNLAQLFIFPTYRKSESLGLVGLEAMACGAVVLLPDMYGPASYGSDGENAFVFTSGDCDSLTEAIERALETDTETIKINARKTAQLYNHQNCDRILKEIFDSFFEN